MRLLSGIIKLIILLLLIILAVFNTAPVHFSYIPGESIELPLIVLLLCFFVIGTLFGMLAMFRRLLTLRNETVRLREEVRKSGRIALEQATAHDSPAPAAAGNQHKAS
ncbi:putative integral membrane protein [Neisseria sp. HSC-16F19]|nr:lipopolysaccharide assembly protein LapA domain-containing protein [Neisseria sp. HSC-16F19]MCP2041277.1 putative integral membrane protein [Neisseria sp. HSC-16F19]